MQSRKVVQMNSLVKNLVELFSDRCATVTEDFSKFVYNKVFFGKIDESEFVTVEKFILGTFQKYINNDGAIVNNVETSADELKMFKHLFIILIKSRNGILMVFDIQGIGNILCDPEIATEYIVDIDDEFLFCLSNLTTNFIL